LIASDIFTKTGAAQGTTWAFVIVITIVALAAISFASADRIIIAIDTVIFYAFTTWRSVADFRRAPASAVLA
jgi:hypothetical protein